MVSLIASETKKIIYKCCKKYGAAHVKKIDDIQLILGLNVILNEEKTAFILADQESPNKYTICEQYRPIENLTIWQVLDIKYPKLDFLGYSKMAPPFIFKALSRMVEKHNIEPDKVFIMCQPSLDEKKKPDVLLALYNGIEFVAEIKFYPKNDDDEGEFLFNDEDMELPTE